MTESTLNEDNLNIEDNELLKEISVPNKVEIISPEQTAEEKKDVLEMNKYFQSVYSIYENILSPELAKNEDLKRDHKKLLMNKIFKILKWQFIGTYIIIGLCVLIVSFSNLIFHISDEILLEIFSFLKFYITSIIVELISILFFIVKNVFDKSIVDLFKGFDNLLRQLNKTNDDKKEQN